MGKEKKKTFFAHQQFNKKIERERKCKQLEEEQRQQQEEEEAAQQQQLEELEKAQQKIQNLQHQLVEAQIENGALETANRENQRENIQLNEQVI
jgi:nitrogen fixation protein FixH